MNVERARNNLSTGKDDDPNYGTPLEGTYPVVAGFRVPDHYYHQPAAGDQPDTEQPARAVGDQLSLF